MWCALKSHPPIIFDYVAIREGDKDLMDSGGLSYATRGWGFFCGQKLNVVKEFGIFSNPLLCFQKIILHHEN